MDTRGAERGHGYASFHPVNEENIFFCQVFKKKKNNGSCTPILVKARRKGR